MSNAQFAKLSKVLGLHKIVRASSESAQDAIEVQGDLFEAFISALNDVCETNGISGDRCTTSFFKKFADENLEIDPERIHGDPKTQVSQMFKRFRNEFLPDVDEPKLDMKADGDSTVHAVLTLNDATFHLMKKFKFKLNNPVLATGSGNTEKSASTIAYSQALSYLTSIGITSSTMASLKHQLEFQVNPDLNPLYPKVLEIMKQQNITNLQFFTPSNIKTKNQATTQLVGDINGKRKIFDTIALTGNVQQRNVRLTLVENFIKNKGAFE